MAKKKTKKSQKTQALSYDYKNIFFSIFFILVWVVSLLWDSTSFLWYYINLSLELLFWIYYKYIFSIIVILIGFFLFIKENFSFNLSRFIWLILFLLSLTSLFWFFLKDYKSVFNFSYTFINLFWFIPWIIFIFIILLFSLFLIFRISYKKIIKKAVSYIPDMETIKDNIKTTFSKDDYDNDNEEEYIEKESLKNTKKIQKTDNKIKKKITFLNDETQDYEEIIKEEVEKNNKTQLKLDDTPQKISIEKEEIKKDNFLNPFSKIKKQEEKESSDDDIYEEEKDISFDSWELPNLNLLEDIWWDIEIDEDIINQKWQEIVEKLAQFKIKVFLDWYRVWPTVIQFRVKPDDWVKLNSIVNLKDDLALALQAKSIRIQAPIPWEWVVWIEVPNPERKAVWLKEVISSSFFTSSKIDIPIAVWKDVSWNIVVWDMTKMPHLLVAWQTASWKSVWVNGFIISMLYKFSPSDLKMILIDPKMVELSIYNWIPHLLTPVITNPDKALNSLKWAVAEMLRRYDLAKNINARNFKEYNAKVSKKEKLPYIVIVVDELADLMMSWNKKEVEQSIARIAQMARAVWMHLIVATQRPSVDVITWLIKANVPSRISFTVASQIDSRTILDKVWAEDLLGRWDMLYSPTWSMEPIRVQWVLVETHEVEAIVNHLKLTIDPDMINNLYDMSISNWKSNMAWSIMEWYSWDQEESPEIIEKAIQVVREAKKWSTSLVQRKLWLWYARRAKVLDILEELWVVWPANWSKPREVYE